MIYHVDLTNDNDTADSITPRTTPEEIEFEWDATFDDEFTRNFQTDLERTVNNEEEQEPDIIKHSSDVEDNNDEEETDTKKDLKFGGVPESPAVYDDLLIYRKRCRLAKSLNPKRLVKYFRTMVHGPWEGWEDL